MSWQNSRNAVPSPHCTYRAASSSCPEATACNHAASMYGNWWLLQRSWALLFASIWAEHLVYRLSVAQHYLLMIFGIQGSTFLLQSSKAPGNSFIFIIYNHLNLKFKICRNVYKQLRFVVRFLQSLNACLDTSGNFILSCFFEAHDR